MSDVDDTQPVPPDWQERMAARRAPQHRCLRAMVAGLSHAGKVRPSNEDNFLVTRMGRSLDVLVTSLPEDVLPRQFADAAFLMMVADGMGGHAAGEVASRTAITTLVRLLVEVPDWIMRVGQEQADEIPRRAALYIAKINEALAERVEQEPSLRGMGTTMTVAYSAGADLFLAHVGDSRAYLYRDGQLRQLTRDHTHVQQLVDAGVLSPESASTHRLRHVLTNALGGSGKEAEVEAHHLHIDEGDRLLLCTDGLTEPLNDEVLAGVLADAADPDAACRALIDMALEHGAPDNVTAVVVDYTICDGRDRRGLGKDSR